MRRKVVKPNVENQKERVFQKKSAQKNKIDIVFANEQEIQSLIDAKSLNEVINFCKNLDNTIVITRGNKGAVAIKKTEVFECPSIQNIKIIDLTGAGDLFAAGFLDGAIKQNSIPECLQKGTNLAARVIQKIGARI